MKRNPLSLRRIAWVALWAASLAAAYYAGSRDGSTAMARAGDRTGNKLAAAAGGAGPAGGRAGAHLSPGGLSGGPEADAGLVALPGTAGDFAARLTDIQSRPPGPARNEALFNLMKEWAAADGPAALAAAGAVTEPKLRFELRETALRHWAAADPEAAWKFAGENPNGDLPDNRLQLVFEGLGRSDPGKALAFFEAHREEMEKQGDRAAMVFDDLYERGGHDQLVGWAEKMPAGRMKDMAMNRIIDRWARYDPEAAKVWMDQHVSTKENTVPARVELAESWARVNPAAALHWANSLPESQRDGEYYNRIYSRWLQYDRNAAAKYLAAQPPSPQLDRPIERYTYEVMRQNPADTMPWAESINDEKMRWRAIERVAEVWRKRDPAALQNYVSANSGLNEEQKRQLLKLEEKRK